jgi:hypothetical protein
MPYQQTRMCIEDPQTDLLDDQAPMKCVARIKAEGNDDRA